MNFVLIYNIRFKDYCFLGVDFPTQQWQRHAETWLLKLDYSSVPCKCWTAKMKRIKVKCIFLCVNFLEAECLIFRFPLYWNVCWTHGPGKGLEPALRHLRASSCRTRLPVAEGRESALCTLSEHCCQLLEDGCVLCCHQATKGPVLLAPLRQWQLSVAPGTCVIDGAIACLWLPEEEGDSTDEKKFLCKTEAEK